MASKRGRPVAGINADLLEKFLQLGFPVATIAREGLLGRKKDNDGLRKRYQKFKKEN